MIGIYSILNKINRKIYIGSSIDIEKRIKEHKTELKGGYHKNKHLTDSYNKYGLESFEFEVLEECEEQFLHSQENFWCNMLNSYNRNYGYNIEIVTPHGSRRIAEETKVKLSNIRKEQYKDPSNNPFFGKKHSEETKAKISASGRGKKKKPWSEETRKKILESRARTYKTKKQC